VQKVSLRLSIKRLRVQASDWLKELLPQFVSAKKKVLNPNQSSARMMLGGKGQLLRIDETEFLMLSIHV